jgi:hypothetical protein
MNQRGVHERDKFCPLLQPPDLDAVVNQAVTNDGRSALWTSERASMIASFLYGTWDWRPIPVRTGLEPYSAVELLKITKNLTGQFPLKSEFQEITIGLSATRKSETERQIVDGINYTI